MIKFSIVIPLYNGAGVIESTLDTVMAQAYKNYEVILVNDESPDNIGDIVKEYIAKHNGINFIYLEQKNKGLGGARNTAIRHASGDVIALLDQDDIWYPDKLAKVAKVYENFPHIDVVCHNQYIRKKGKISGVMSIGPGADDMHRYLLFNGNCLSTSATTFKKDAIERVDYFSEEVDKLHFVEDYDLWLNMAYLGYKFYFMPDFLGEYVLHGNNSTNYELTCKGNIYVLNKHYRIMKNKRVFDYLRYKARMAESLFVASYISFFNNRDLKKGFFYSLKAFLNNPLLLFRAIKKSLRFSEREA